MQVFVLFLRFLFFFLSYFPLVMEKDDKTCFNAETNYFDQQTACGAPVSCSKYITDVDYVMTLVVTKVNLFYELLESEPI